MQVSAAEPRKTSLPTVPTGAAGQVGSLFRAAAGGIHSHIATPQYQLEMALLLCCLSGVGGVVHNLGGQIR